jgi:gluconate 5-dehydrogenase
MRDTIQRLFSLDDVVALVTGSSGGIGLALARGLAEAGARVVVNGRDSGKVAAAVASMKSEGLVADAAVFDVTDPQGVERAVARIEQEIGAIHVLVNNAGIQRRTPLEDFPPETWRELMRTNLDAVFYVGQAVARRMIPRRKGRIINIASVQSELADQHRALHGLKGRREDADQRHGDGLGQAWSVRQRFGAGIFSHRT